MDFGLLYHTVWDHRPLPTFIPPLFTSMLTTVNYYIRKRPTGLFYRQFYSYNSFRRLELLCLCLLFNCHRVRNSIFTIIIFWLTQNLRIRTQASPVRKICEDLDPVRDRHRLLTSDIVTSYSRKCILLFCYYWLLLLLFFMYFREIVKFNSKARAFNSRFASFYFRENLYIIIKTYMGIRLVFIGWRWPPQRPQWAVHLYELTFSYCVTWTLIIQ